MVSPTFIESATLALTNTLTALAPAIISVITAALAIGAGIILIRMGWAWMAGFLKGRG